MCAPLEAGLASWISLPGNIEWNLGHCDAAPKADLHISSRLPLPLMVVAFVVGDDPLCAWRAVDLKTYVEGARIEPAKDNFGLTPSRREVGEVDIPKSSGLQGVVQQEMDHSSALT